MVKTGIVQDFSPFIQFIFKKIPKYLRMSKIFANFVGENVNK